jgi:hypothetical protein
MTVSIRWQSKCGNGRLARLTVRGDLSQVSIANQEIIMRSLGRLMIDRIRYLWERGYLLTGAAAGNKPPRGLRRTEKAILEERITKKLKREIQRQGLAHSGRLKGPATKKPLAALKPDQQDAHIKAMKAAKAKARQEYARRVVNNYKIRSPRFTRTAIHGTERPRSRFYIPNPDNPALYGSGLMKDSLYCIYLPMRSYTDKNTGQRVQVQSGFQFMVQKNRHTASYRAGLTPAGVGAVMRDINDVDLNNMVRNYVSWDGTAAHKLFLAVCETAGKAVGLVEGIAGFIL